MVSLLNAVKREQQTVAVNSNVLFSENRFARGCSIRHDNGSGLVSLRAGVYRITFNGNVSAAAVAQVKAAIKLNGEALGGAIMTQQIAAANNIVNVSSDVIVKIPCDTSSTISVGNIGTSDILIDNANITVGRIADCCGGY